MTTPEPLEKQLFALDLSKGMDERTRPELLNGAQNVTYIENLVQDQAGSWVKRPGTTLGPESDVSGTESIPSGLRKVMALVRGWAVIADGGHLLHKQDHVEAFRTKQQVMDLNVLSARFIGSSSNDCISPVAGPNVRCVASSTLHDAMVIGLVESSRLIISERATGVEYSYNPNDLASPTATDGARIIKQMVFVGDRYLHVFIGGWLNATTASTVRVFVIDTLSELPVDLSGYTPVTVITDGGAGARRVVNDAVGGGDRSWVITQDSDDAGVTLGTSDVFTQAASTGANIDTYASATETFTSIDVDEVTANEVVLLSDAASNFTLTFLSSTNSATVTATLSGTEYAATYVNFNTGNGSVCVVLESTATFGGSTLGIIQKLTVAGGSHAAFTVDCQAYGWLAVSKPFYLPSTGKHYMHLAGYDSLNSVSSHVIADLSTFTPFDVNTATTPPMGSFRNACNLEPYNGLKFAARASGWTSDASTGFYGGELGPRSAFRYSLGSGEVSACTPYQVAARAAGIPFSRLRAFDAGGMGVANFGGATYLAHGGLSTYEGDALVDAGFADMPAINKVTPGTTVGLLNGSYRYVAVFRRVNANGDVTYSKTFGPVAATNVPATTGQNNLTLAPWGVTNTDVVGSYPIVELYRTLTGGTVYYLCASSQRGQRGLGTTISEITQSASTGLFSVTDNLADATLALNAQMHRQPGTVGAPADRYVAPACKFVVQHKDRLFCADPYGQRVYYSSFFVDGESAWFNPAFSFFVHAGTGPITGLASMDGRLFIFKRDVIFVVDGDGPGESGPTGNEFSPPQALASSYGCIDHRSIVGTPQGVVFRSSRGFELMKRDTKLSWFGEPVWQTSDAYPVTTAACIDPDSRLHFTLAEAEGLDGVTGESGIELVYDMPTESWSAAKYTMGAGAYGRAQQGAAVVINDGVETVVYADEDSGVYLADKTLGTDDEVYVPWEVASGWVKLGVQVRQRVSNVLVLAKRQDAEDDSNHALKMQLAFDYVDSYVQQTVWEPDVLNALAVEDICIKPQKQQVLAFKVRVTEQEPDDTGTYPVGTGLGAAVLGITAEMAAIQNAPFANRGTIGVLSVAPAVGGIVPASGGVGGGIAVAIYGVNFTASSTVTIGGVAATSVVQVSSTQLTAVTPAGTIGDQDVAVTTSGGTGTLVDGFEYLSALFDPATLLASVWLKEFAGLPWQPSASAGISGETGPFVTNVNDPSVGTLNGHGTAVFDGVNDNTPAQYAVARQVWSRTAGGIIVLFKANSADAPTGSFYNDSNLIIDGGGTANMGMSFTTSGVGAWAYSGSYGNVNKACPADGSWHLAMMRWDGVNAGLTVDSATEDQFACGSIPLGVDLPIVSYKYGVGGRFDGAIAEVLCFRSTPSPTDYANFKSYVNATYALTL